MKNFLSAAFEALGALGGFCILFEALGALGVFCILFAALVWLRLTISICCLGGKKLGVAVGAFKAINCYQYIE